MISKDVSCPQCGTLNNAEAKFCQYCGDALPRASIVSPQNTLKKRRLLTAAVGVVILILIISGVAISQFMIKRPTAISKATIATISTSSLKIAVQNQFNLPETLVGIAFSPDGQTLATWSYEGTIYLWNVTDNSKLSEIDTGSEYGWHSSPSHETIAFSPNGELLAYSSRDGNVYFWDLRNNSIVHQIQVPQESTLSTIAYSPDGRFLAIAGNRLTLWNVTEDNYYLVYQKERPSGWAGSLAFSPDSQTLAFSIGQHVSLWQVENGALLHVLEGDKGLVGGFSFSSDGQYIVSAAFDDDVVRVWEIASGQLVRTLVGRGIFINRVNAVFSPDDRLVVSNQGDVRVWRVSDGSKLYQFGVPQIQDFVGSMSFLPHGQILVVGFDGHIQLIRMVDGLLMRELYNHPGWVTGISVSPDTRLMASCSDDGTLIVWDISSLN